MDTGLGPVRATRRKKYIYKKFRSQIFGRVWNCLVANPWKLKAHLRLHTPFPFIADFSYCMYYFLSVFNLFPFFQISSLFFFGMAAMPFSCNGILHFQGNLPRVIQVVFQMYRIILLSTRLFFGDMFPLWSFNQLWRQL